ncbi:MAG: 1-deoxy-D-xylulose-5-phosphate reductoisomerase [Clostridia bacterium]|uniref:1-deoxy-D-xylulose-5-phosphate reductoisomerase n=1 Tax=Pumilibacter muris TaxID=2941510 RepID=UPI00203C21CB|nr:1-deoxy-D-xylulose-5-phosphate reductoisomerase [Pumilibacter muris]MCI8595953.1 1-deoxy-D-xylulose-5-phosphate reductoisomerase [Clostridia bacterium]
MKRIALIGSTGYIGTQTLQIVEKYPDKFKIVSLTANENSELLIAQAKKFKPEYAGICDCKQYRKVRDALLCEVGCGAECLKVAASVNCDIVLVAVVGCVGLTSVLAAIENGTTVALANKESLVAAGKLVTTRAREKGVSLLPVDSEHSAIWQCLRAGRESDVKRLILTASGGPFYRCDKKELLSVTPEAAVNHPTWRMGKKISVDSATMMNKGLEIIEARWLFDTLNIDYVIHPQSIVHSMVEFCDGSVIAQMSSPDMRLPIQSALSYPERFESDVKPLEFCSMTFLPPKEELFPLPMLAKRCLQTGGTAPCIMNAANEAAVALFLNGKIGFTQIGELVRNALDSANVTEYSSSEEIFAVHNETYEKLMMDYN